MLGIIKRLLFIILLLPASILVLIMIIVFPITWAITGKDIGDSYGDFPFNVLKYLKE